MFCSKCGKELPEGSKFCPDCGTSISDVNGGAAQQTASTSVAAADSVSPKSRVCALLLGIFLGSLGIHNFYLGKVGKGIAQLLLNIFGMVLYVVGLAMTTISIAEEEDFAVGGAVLLVFGLLVILAVGIWVLVDWIIVAAGKAKDKQGRPVINW